MKQRLPVLAGYALLMLGGASSCLGSGGPTEVIVDVVAGPSVPVFSIDTLEVSLATGTGTSLHLFPIDDELDDMQTSISVQPQVLPETLSIGIVATDGGLTVASGSVDGVALIEGETISLEVLIE